MRNSGRARWLIGGGIATVILVVAVVAWQLAFRDTSTPVTVDEALARYRAQAKDGDTPIPAGVYVYATNGSEEISALGGRRHRYPARSTVTVAPGGCGMTLRWDVLTSRSNRYEICRSGTVLAVWTESHRFIGRDDRTTWRCRSTNWLPADDTPGAMSPYGCRGGDTVQRGTSIVVGEEPVTVGSGTVVALHVRINAVESGGARGPVTEERWLEPASGLPLRITYNVTTKNASPIGDVTFTERYDVRLTSLEPRR
jgi:hypothetical protein